MTLPDPSTTGRSTPVAPIEDVADLDDYGPHWFIEPGEAGRFGCCCADDCGRNDAVAIRRQGNAGEWGGHALCPPHLDALGVRHAPSICAACGGTGYAGAPSATGEQVGQ